MATSWGDYDNNIRVGIDITVASQSDTSITYDIDFWLQSRYTISDTMDFATSGSGISSTTGDVTISNSGGGTKLIRSTSYTRSKVYGGGPTLTYNVRITGGHFDGGTPSQSRSVTVPARPADPPDKVGTPDVSNVTGDSAKMTWDAPGTNGASISGYQVQRALNSSFTSGASSVQSTTSRSYLFDETLDPGTTYYCRVRATSSAGSGAWSNARSFSTLDTPGKVVTTAASSITHNSAATSWSAPSSGGASITGYDVQISTSSSMSGATTTTQTGLSKTFSGLSAGTTYYYRVRATNSVGDGAWSTVRSFTTNDVPAAPATPTSSVPAATSVKYNWTAPSNGGSAITGYDVQLSTSSTFSTVLQTQSVSSSTLTYTFTGLDRGVTYYGRVRAKNAAGNGAYSAGKSATTYWEDLSGYPTAAPTVVLSSGIATSHRALFRVEAEEPHPFPAGVLKFQYELSQSSSFTSPITGEYDLDPNTINNGQAGETFTWDNDLQMGFSVPLTAQGTWYLRVRTGGTDSLPYSPWTDTLTWTSAHIPAATIIGPGNDSRILYGSATAFSFNVTDPSPNEAMSAYEIEVQRNDDSTSVLDTGKVASTFPKGQNVVSGAISSTYKDVVLRWRVRVWDSTDTASQWSAWSLFRLVDAPVVTITTPADDGTVTTGAPTVTWTVGLTSDRTQASAVVRIFDLDGNQIWQRTVTGNATKTVTPATPVLVNGQQYTVTVTVNDTASLTGSDTNNFTATYVSPSPLKYLIESRLDDDGYILVDWSGIEADSRIVAWRVYRRLIPDGEWELIDEINDETTREYRDYMIRSGETYMYNVTQVADRSGELLESPLGTMIADDDSVGAETRVFLAMFDHYWLIVPDNQDYSMRLPTVTTADEELQFEDSTMTLIGRGRHRDYGDELGYKGSITFQIRQPEVSSQVRRNFENLRRLRETYILRTPFGRLYQVALGDVGWSPIAGVGISEMGDITFEWEEVV